MMCTSFSLFKDFYLSACLYVNHMPAGACTVQKRALEPLELELKQAIVSCQVLVLGSELRSSWLTTDRFNGWLISPL